jgi:hypothetical protein
VVSPRRGLFWDLVVRTARRSPRHLPWAVQKAIQGEHFLRYTTEDVLPRIERAIAAVRAERSGQARVSAHDVRHLPIARPVDPQPHLAGDAGLSGA